MVVAPEVHTPHHHAHTGHRWFDFVMGGSALLISCISLYVAVHHGQTMEKLVEANSFPSIEVSIDLEDSDHPGAAAFKVDVSNDGVGPARVETLQIWNGQTPVTSAAQITNLIKEAGDGLTLHARFAGDTIIGALIGAGKSRTLINIQPEDGAKWYPALARIALNLRTRVCYCSVFNECYVAENGTKIGRPVHVQECTTPQDAYQDDLTALVSHNADPAPEAK